jgi:nucleotide-binding universal stress UspA family protein
MKPIVLATDGSPSAEAATREALDLALALDAPLLVVSVAHTVLPPYGGYYGYGAIATDLHQAEAQHVKQILAEHEERALAADVSCETIGLDGPAAEAICRTAQAHDARMIVIGAHGWGTIGRFLHGSVSTYVLHHADCPVLVVQNAVTAPIREASRQKAEPVS